jgi:hypothetical protein
MNNAPNGTVSIFIGRERCMLAQLLSMHCQLSRGVGFLTAKSKTGWREAVGFVRFEMRVYFCSQMYFKNLESQFHPNHFTC